MPGKNTALLAGKPLLTYAIESAVDSGVFDTVCVSSDDDAILDVARRSDGCLVLKRPDELATDTATVTEVCGFLLSQFADQGKPFDVFALLLPTNPLRTARDVSDAWKVFSESEADFLMSLIPYSYPPQHAVTVRDGLVRPAYPEYIATQSQALDPLYRHDGSIIIARSEAFLTAGDLYAENSIGFFSPPERSVDVDSPQDLAWAEFLLSRQGE